MCIFDTPLIDMCHAVGIAQSSAGQLHMLTCMQSCPESLFLHAVALLSQGRAMLSM